MSQTSSTGRTAGLRPLMIGAVAVGGALGGLARYGVETVMPGTDGGHSWATSLVNVSGSLLVGVLLAGVRDARPGRHYVAPFATVGFLGAFTTFGTWMVDVDLLLLSSRPLVAALTLAGPLCGGVAAAALGVLLGRGLVRVRRR